MIDKRRTLKEVAQIKDSNPSQDKLYKYEQLKKILYATYDREKENYLQTKIDEITTAVVNLR